MNIKANLLPKQVVSFATCFLSFVLIWIIALPFVRQFYKSIPLIVRWPLIVVTATILVYVNMGFTLWFASLPLFVLEAHCLIGFIWSKESTYYVQARKTLFLLLIMLCHIGLAIGIKTLVPHAWDPELEVWLTRITEYLQSARNSEGLMERWGQLYNYLPAFYFSAFLSAYLLSFWGTPPLNKIEVPSVFFWTILLSFCLAFIELKGLQMTVPPNVIVAAKNLFFPLCCLYFFQGVAVLNSLFDKVKIARFWRNIWYILIILYMPVGLVLLGVAEFLFEYREKYKEKRKDLE